MEELTCHDQLQKVALSSQSVAIVVKRSVVQVRLHPVICDGSSRRNQDEATLL